jgi:hypothetical protein
MIRAHNQERPDNEVQLLDIERLLTERSSRRG